MQASCNVAGGPDTQLAPARLAWPASALERQLTLQASGVGLQFQPALSQSALLDSCPPPSKGGPGNAPCDRSCLLFQGWPRTARVALYIIFHSQG
jgi:hypothetical protein